MSACFILYSYSYNFQWIYFSCLPFSVLFLVSSEWAIELFGAGFEYLVKKENNQPIQKQLSVAQRSVL